MFGVKFSSSTSSLNWPPEFAASTVSPPNSCEPIERQSKVATLPYITKDYLDDALVTTSHELMLTKSNVFNAGTSDPLHFRQVRGLVKTLLKTKEIWSGRGDLNARPPAAQGRFR